MLRRIGWVLIVGPAGVIVLLLLAAAFGALTGAHDGDGGTGEALVWVGLVALNSLLPVAVGCWIVIATRSDQAAGADR